MTPTEWIIKMHNQAEKLEDFFNQTIDAETRLFALGKAFGIRQAIDSFHAVNDFSEQAK